MKKPADGPVVPEDLEAPYIRALTAMLASHVLGADAETLVAKNYPEEARVLKSLLQKSR
jgi:hypothetical protein